MSLDAALALRASPRRGDARPHQVHRDLSAVLWTACGIALALLLLFAFFFRMEESMAAQPDTPLGADADWAQRHWQCSAVPVMKQAACEAQLAQAVQVETADAGRVAR